MDKSANKFKNAHLKDIIDTENVKDLIGFIEMTGYSGNSHIFMDAILIGNLEILKILHKSGCPHPKGNTCIRRASHRKYIDIIGYLISEGFVYDDYDVCSICMIGDVSLVKALHARGDVKSEDVIYGVIASKSLECLIYLHDVGYHFDEDDLQRACIEGAVSMVEFLHQKCGLKLPDRPSPYEYARGVQVVKYVREIMSIEFNPDTFERLMYEGDVEVLNYLYHSDCHIPENIGAIALDVYDLDVIKFIHGIGAPFPIDVNYFKGEDHDIARYYYDVILGKQ